MSVQYLSKEDGEKLAYVYTPGDGPVVMFLGGYRSDMSGTKATAFEEFCRAHGQAYLRFDYGGHGLSDGRFEDGLIGSWAADAIKVLDEVTDGPVLLVGSSMGGWMAFLTALARPERICGMIGIAAAPDFTEELYARLSPEQKKQMEKAGFAEIGNDYSDEPYHFPQKFYLEAKNQLVLGKNHHFSFPIHLFQGEKDIDVPPKMVKMIQNGFKNTQITASFIPDGDHRLSRAQDIALICEKIAEMSDNCQT